LDARAGLGSSGGDGGARGNDGRAGRLSRSEHDERNLLYSFAGALLGGLNNPLGAVIGGLCVGVIENLGAYIVGTQLKLSLALAIILGILVIKPAGLFGRRVLRRV
jgi:ABC-type branched-subunit amino acid transport system permease subunit